MTPSECQCVWVCDGRKWESIRLRCEGEVDAVG